MFNPSSFKKDFPILSQKMNGKPLIYLDNAATTQKPQSVIDAISNFYQTSNANIHRGVYPLAQEATDLYEKTRTQVASFINAKDRNEIIFTRNTTESINLVAHAWGRKFLKAGDSVLISEMEHHANFVPWYMLSKEIGITLKVFPLKDNATLNLTRFKELLTSDVKLVAVTAMSNVLGTINPLDQIIELARKNHSYILVDGAQSVPHMPTDIQKLDCDFFAFSAHKMLGPTGVGILWAKKKILEEMNPFMGGGEMINTVSVQNTTWADVPLKFEAGTSNFADVAAFSASLDYLKNLGMHNVREHEKHLVAYALEKMQKISDITIYGPQDPELQGGAISFNHKIVHAHDVGTILGDEGVAIRVGHHCAQPLMKALGVSSTARLSFYVYTTEDDIDAFITSLDKVNQVFGLSGAKSK